MFYGIGERGGGIVRFGSDDGDSGGKFSFVKLDLYTRVTLVQGFKDKFAESIES